MDGNFPPAKDFHAFLLRDYLKHAPCQRPAERILRQEEHADAVVAFLKACYLIDSGLRRRFDEKSVGDLRQDPDAVSHFSGGVLSCPVLQFFHNMKRVIQDLVILSTVNVYDTSDAAGIMFLLIPHGFSSYLSENSIFS